MSNQELAAYNLSVPVEQRVHCYMKSHVSSRIPRLVCETLEQIYGGTGSDAMAVESAMPSGQIFVIN